MTKLIAYNSTKNLRLEKYRNRYYHYYSYQLQVILIDKIKKTIVIDGGYYSNTTRRHQGLILSHLITNLDKILQNDYRNISKKFDGYIDVNSWHFAISYLFNMLPDWYITII